MDTGSIAEMIYCLASGRVKVESEISQMKCFRRELTPDMLFHVWNCSFALEIYSVLSVWFLTEKQPPGLRLYHTVMWWVASDWVIKQ